MQKNILENFKVEDMYTTLSDAKKQIQERKKDSELRKKAEKFFGLLPDVFSSEPKAIIFRNIATPNLELQLAKEYSQLLGLDLVVIEYSADKFCTRNRDKLHLGKMMFYGKKSKTQAVGKENIIDIKCSDSKPFCEIKTTWGEDLIGFHHRIFNESGFEDVEIFDASVFKEMGLDAKGIYLKILSLCIDSAVLLENFLIKAESDGNEQKFTEGVILPAFLEVMDYCQTKPLIVPLFGVDDQGSVSWQYYPEKVKDFIK